MSNICELVLFTAGSKPYADKVLEVIDKDNLISQRRYNDSIWDDFKRNHHDKRVDFLGRDIRRTILVDNNRDTFSLNPS
jgi:TFIIF-interacting CTD phosphatase-like protein